MTTTTLELSLMEYFCALAAALCMWEAQGARWEDRRMKWARQYICFKWS